MKNLCTIIIALLLLSGTAFAQSATITGKVTANNTVVEKATILLLKALDSQLVKTAVSNSNGLYEFTGIKADKYIIQITNVGYKSNYSKPFTIAENSDSSVEDIVLTIAPKTGEVATVIGKKPLIEVKADKMVFNVENSINAIGSNAFELLRKSPGVVVDKDDNIILKGKNGVRIYVDGKPTPFDGKDLADYLKTLNSADIEAIELITNPSAKYSAEGNAGIINIRLKKNKKLGYNGSFNTGLAVGIHPKFNSSLALNYRKNKWNVFSNYSNNYGKNQNQFNLYRIQLDSIYDQKTVSIDNSKTNNFKVGVDYSADKTSTWGIVLTGNLTSANTNSRSTNPITNKDSKILGSTLFATNSIVGNRNNYNANLNYRYADTTGVEVGFDADYGWFKNELNSYQPNEYRYQNNLTNPVYKIYSNLTPTDIDITSFKVDVGMPYKKAKIEFGAKYGAVKTRNASDFFNVINGVNVVDVDRTNKFNYTENVNAAYFNYNKTFNQKWTLQAGIRLENTVSKGVLLSANPKPDDIVSRNYTNLFPSGAVSYNANPSNAYNLTYSRRIDRPGYQDLNPFEFKIDELTFQKGNAFLRPQYSNVIEFTHTYKYRYNTTLSYTNTTDFFSQIIDTAEGYKSFITQKNLANQKVYGINFSAPVQVAKWWNLFANINANHTTYNATFPDGKTVNTKATSGSFFAQNTFSLKKGFNVEVSGFYQLPTIWGGTFESKGIGGMDVGLSSPLFNNKATIKFSYTDLLRTMRWRGISTFGAAYIDASGRWESQQFKMNFGYRFGNNKLKGANQKKAGNETEQNRAKKSGGGFGG